MKILHTVAGMGAKGGGTSSCTYQLLKGLREENIDASVLCYEPSDDDILVGDESFIITVGHPSEQRFLYSSNFKDGLEEQEYDLYHANGLWQYPEYITAFMARKKNKPYIISPHGMLYPQAFKKSGFIKKIFYNLFLHKDLRYASAIHATCEEEMVHLRDMGIATPIAIIPNAIEINSLLSKKIQTKDKIKFGYLGRVHPRKKIEKLLYVWSVLGDKVAEAELIIIGSGDDEYMDFLKSETQKLNLKNVIYTGFLTGESKDNVLKELSYLAVPSDFENFGMIVVEALAMGIPVIASKGTPWQELEEYQCGWWVDNDIESFSAAFDNALIATEDERLLMAQRGRKLILEKYNAEIVAKKMVQLYDWILKGGAKPDFVYL